MVIMDVNQTNVVSMGEEIDSNNTTNINNGENNHSEPLTLLPSTTLASPSSSSSPLSPSSSLSPSLALSGSIEFASSYSPSSSSSPSSHNAIKDGSDRSPAMSPNPIVVGDHASNGGGEVDNTISKGNGDSSKGTKVPDLTVNGSSLSPSKRRDDKHDNTSPPASSESKLPTGSVTHVNNETEPNPKSESTVTTTTTITTTNNSDNNTITISTSTTETNTVASSNSSSSPSPSSSSSSSTLASSVGSPSLAKKKTVEDFEFGEVIGEGSFGEVRIATDKVTRHQYAAKILHKKQIVKENKVKYVNSEKVILNLLDHCNIVRLFFTFQTKEDLYYILELCPKGELLHLIKQAGCLEKEVARFYGAEVLSAIAYMHDKGVAHRDIKPENVLLNPDMHARLSDFGTAKEIVRGGRSQSFVGTAEYVCPELLSQRAAGQEADMWSYGVMLFQMLTGNLPFKGVSEFQVFQEITKNEITVPDSVDPDAKDLISKLLVSDPTVRITAAEAKLHPFFSGIDFNALESTKPPVVTPKLVQLQVVPPPTPSPSGLIPTPNPIPSSSSLAPTLTSDKAAESVPHKKSPNIIKRLRGEKNRASSPAMTPVNPPSPTPPTASSSSPSTTKKSSSSNVSGSPLPNTASRRSMMTTSASSPQLSLLTLSTDGRIQGTAEQSRARASTEFSAPPLFLSKPSDHSRWATFLATDERILHSGVVQLRKKMFFSRQKLFLFITDRRLALLEPDTWKVNHEYIWGSIPINASLKYSKSFILTTGNKVRLFEDVAGNTKELVELIQYLGTPKSK